MNKTSLPKRRWLALAGAATSLAALALVTGDPTAPAVTVSAGSTLKEDAVSASAANGAAVVVWRGDDGDQGSIFARLYDDQGRPRGAEFRVNSNINSVQELPAVAMNAGGDFVVVWTSRQQATQFSSEIEARRYRADGTALGDVITVNATTANDQSLPAVAMALNGDFLVAWQTFTDSELNNDVFARRFSAGGVAQTAGDQAMNTTLPNSQRDTSVSLRPDGSGLVAWTSFGQEPDGAGIYARRIGADGLASGGETALHTVSAGIPETVSALAFAADGTLCAAWQAPASVSDATRQIYLRRFSAAGSPLANEARISTGNDAKADAWVAADANGDCALSYQTGDGNTAANYYLRLTDANQLPVTPQIVVSSAALPGGVAADADGDVLVSYLEADGIKARRYVGPERVDVSLILSGDRSAAAPGSSVRYRLMVSNLHAAGSGFSGPVNAAIGQADNVRIAVPTPAGTRRRNLTADAGWDCTGSSEAMLVCNRNPGLAATANASLGFELVMPLEPASVTVNASASASQSDANLINNSASQDVLVRNPTYQFAALTAAEAQLPESGNGVTLRVTVSPPADGALDIPISSNGTVSSNDFTLGNGASLSIPAGAGEGLITVQPGNDSVDEDDETLTLTLGSTTGAALGTPSAQTLTIVDDDAAPSLAFTASQIGVGEGASREAVLRLSAPSSRPVQVAFSVSEIGASASDYVVAGSSPLSIAPGQQEARLTISATEDRLNESNEQIRIALASPQNASLGAPSLLTVALNDNDPLPTVGFSPIQGAVREGEMLRLTLRLSEIGGRDTSGSLRTSGTADAGQDYRLSRSDFTIPAGQLETTVDVQALGDGVDEQDENIQIVFDALVNTEPRNGAEQTNLTLVDANAPSVRFAEAARTVTESVGTVSFTVLLSTATERDLAIPFQLSGEASASDVLAAVSPLRIPAGSDRGSIVFTITDDALDENDERLIVTLEQPTGATIASPGSLVVTITDNDAPPSLRIASAPTALAEGETGNFVFQLSGASSRLITATLVAAGGSAGTGDFQLQATQLRFEPGTTTVSLSATVPTDTLSEGDETVQLELREPSNASLGTPTSHTLLLRDTAPPATGRGGLLDGGTGGSGGGAFGWLTLLPLMLAARRRKAAG